MSKDEPGTASRFKDQYFLSVSVCLKPRPHRSVCLRPGCGIVVRVEQEVRTQCRDTSRNERIQVMKFGGVLVLQSTMLDIYIYIYKKRRHGPVPAPTFAVGAKVGNSCGSRGRGEAGEMAAYPRLHRT